MKIKGFVFILILLVAGAFLCFLQAFAMLGSGISLADVFIYGAEYTFEFMILGIIGGLMILAGIIWLIIALIRRKKR